MILRKYRGRLTYDGSSAYVEVESLIVRETEIAYSLASVSQEHGKWIAESGKPATLQIDGTFLAKRVWASKLGVRAGSPWDISFKIEYEEQGKLIEVSGSIAEADDIGEFYGELVVAD